MNTYRVPVTVYVLTTVEVEAHTKEDAADKVLGHEAVMEGKSIGDAFETFGTPEFIVDGIMPGVPEVAPITGERKYRAVRRDTQSVVIFPADDERATTRTRRRRQYGR